MILSVGVKCLKLSKQSKETSYNYSMMKQQLVWQDMDQAPKDREILVGIKSECDGPIRFDSVVFNLEEFEEDEDGEESDPGFASAKNTWFSYNDDYYYSNDELVGWIEVPQAK